MRSPGLGSSAIGIVALLVLVTSAFAQSGDKRGSAALKLNPEPVGVAAARSDEPDRIREQESNETGIKKRIVVDGNTGLNWVDTGLIVSPGDVVRLAATGEVDVKSEWGAHGPEGTTKFAEQPPGYYPVESKTRYGLAARITSSKGKEQQKWSYGDAREMLVKQGGRLWLTVNDDAPDGNEGEFVVNITIVLKKD